MKGENNTRYAADNQLRLWRFTLNIEHMDGLGIETRLMIKRRSLLNLEGRCGGLKIE